MGKYDDVESVDDPVLEGFSLDARKMFVADALKKKQQRATTTEETAAHQQWAQYIDDQIDKSLDAYTTQLKTRCSIMPFNVLRGWRRKSVN